MVGEEGPEKGFQAQYRAAIHSWLFIRLEALLKLMVYV